MQEKNNELDQMKEDLDGMKDEMSEIKSLLLSLNQKLNNQKNGKTGNHI